jgi:transcriptional regulator with XRE-family HTH domain
MGLAYSQENTTMKFHLFLAELLKERGVTGYRLAKDIGRAQPTVASWLTGARTPTMKHLVDLVEHLDLSPSDAERLYRLHREAAVSA